MNLLEAGFNSNNRRFYHNEYDQGSIFDTKIERKEEKLLFSNMTTV